MCVVSWACLSRGSDVGVVPHIRLFLVLWLVRVFIICVGVNNRVSVCVATSLIDRGTLCLLLSAVLSTCFCTSTTQRGRCDDVFERGVCKRCVCCWDFELCALVRVSFLIDLGQGVGRAHFDVFFIFRAALRVNCVCVFVFVRL